VKDLYSKWGGIASYVLKLATNTDKQEDLTKTFGESDIYSILKSLGDSSKKAEASNCLIHISVTYDFHSGPYVFASEYVADEMYHRTYLKDREHLIRFNSANDGYRFTGQLGGTMFEKYTHTVLASGSSFKIRDLETNVKASDRYLRYLSVNIYFDSPRIYKWT